MRSRGSEVLAAVLLVGACGRSGLELDEVGGAPGEGGTAGVALRGGSGGSGGGAGASAGGGAGIGFCQASFSSNLPDDGAENLSTKQQVSVGFTCTDGGSVDPNGISLALRSPVSEVDGKAVWDAASGRLVLTPAAPLALATRYTAVAASVAGTLTWSFSTTDGSWQPEEEVGTGGDLVLAVSPDGHGIVAFNTGAEIWFRRFTMQDGLAKVAGVLSDEPITPRSLRIGIAGGGNAVAVWGQADGILRGRHGALSGWGNVEYLDPGLGPGLIEDLAVAGDGTGVALTSFRSATEEPGMLRAIPLRPGSFEAASTLTSVIPLDTVRAVARPGGRSWSVWSSWAETGQVSATHAEERGVFRPRVVLAEPAARAGFAAMGQDGSLLAIWQEGSPPSAVMAARFTPEGESQPPAPLDTRVPDRPSSGVYARIAVDGLGRAMALWVNEGEEASGVVEEIRAQRFEGSWAPRHVALSAPTVGEWAVISPMGLVLDPQGNGFAGFGHGAPARAQVQRFLESSGWQSALVLAESATAPLVAADASGRAAVAWASGGRVYLRRFIELTAPRPRH